MDTDATTLELRLVGRIEGHFFVPRYQRGYRWGKVEVRQLLNDLWEGAQKDKDERYCLQPVVVKRLPDESFELVDGQQRLTTLFLLYAYFRREGLKNIDQPYTIHYETRDRCAEFLATIGEKTADAAPAPNIDFFHIQQAYREIATWFSNPGPASDERRNRQLVADELYRHLGRNVSVIWYEAPSSVDSNTLFRRLNHGRIPLTNAELIKALLFTGPVLRREEMAAQWDGIERDLRDPALWAFLTNELADTYPTRVQLLFDLMAKGPTGRARTAFYSFEALREQIVRDPAAFWDRVLELHARVREWFEDRHLYHWIGYLIATGESLQDLSDGAGSMTRSRFREYVQTRIRATLALSRADLSTLSYERDSDRRKCQRALLLMNVESVRTVRHSTERYSFLQHKRRGWSLEHVHAQHAETLRGDKARRAWLDEHRSALGALGLEPKVAARLGARMDAEEAVTNATFPVLVADVVRAFTLAGDDQPEASHGLANMALLARDDNSSLNNSAFEVKRRLVLKLDREGAYIPLCTRQLFLKYFSEAAGEHLHFWGPADRHGYMTAIVQALDPFLSDAPPHDLPEGT